MNVFPQLVSEIKDGSVIHYSGSISMKNQQEVRYPLWDAINGLSLDKYNKMQLLNVSSLLINAKGRLNDAFDYTPDDIEFYVSLLGNKCYIYFSLKGVNTDIVALEDYINKLNNQTPSQNKWLHTQYLKTGYRTTFIYLVEVAWRTREEILYNYDTHNKLLEFVFQFSILK